MDWNEVRGERGNATQDGQEDTVYVHQGQDVHN